MHGNAALSGVGEASGNATVRGISQIGVAVHDGSGVAPEFQCDFLFSGTALDLPPNGYAPRKSDQFYPLISYQQTRILVRKRQDIKAAIRPACLLNALRQQQGRQRRLRRRFQDHGAARGDCRRNFVCDQVQREIERRDPRDRAQGKAFHDAPAPSCKLLPVEGKIFTVNSRSFFGGDVEDKNRAVHFRARQLDWFASLLRDGAGEFFSALSNGLSYTPEHALPLEGRKSTGSAKSLH